MLEEDGHNSSEILFFQGELYRQRGKTPQSKSDNRLLSFLNSDDDKKQENDFETALGYYAKALNSPNPLPAIYRSIGLTQQRLGNLEEAKKAFSTYLSLANDPKDRQIIKYMLERIS